MFDEPYRPQFHFTPASGWMNDPNGLVYFQGEYHLFYQYLTPRHWGHAVSADLVHWTELPVALYPDELGDIWSGSVVVDHADSSGFFGGRPGLVAVFTHHNTRSTPEGPEMQSLAFSHDNGRSWSKYTGNPVIPNPGVSDFRDPKVFWHEPSGRWVMIVTYKRDRVRFYVSPNLKDWEHVSEFGADQGGHGGTWECPDLFEIPIEGEERRTKWILHVSLFHHPARAARGSWMQYFVGDFDGTTFTNDHPADVILWSDFGRDNYAAVTWSDLPGTDGRRIFIGWMSNWTYAHHLPTTPWQGAMTLPRRLGARHYPQGMRLIQTPVIELQSLRDAGRHWDSKPITPDRTMRVPSISDATEILITFQLETATECGVKICTGESQHTGVAYDVQKALLLVDRTYAGLDTFSLDFSGTQQAPLIPIDGRVCLHLFVDRASIEVFGNDGESVITSLIFPDTTGNERNLEVYTVNGSVQLVALDIYQLRPIWTAAGAQPSGDSNALLERN